MFMTMVMKPKRRKKKQSIQAQHWMFLASLTSFLLATIYEAALLAAAGILIHSGLIGYPALSQVERQLIINSQISQPNYVVSWISTFAVRVLINGA